MKIIYSFGVSKFVFMLSLIMDTIFIKGLVVPSVIGIYGWERSCFQKVVFDLDIAYSNMIDIGSMDINNCYLDYEKVSVFLYKIVSGNHFFLVESVAEYVARELMLKFNISWLRVKVRKLGVLTKGVDVGVVIERGVKL